MRACAAASVLILSLAIPLSAQIPEGMEGAPFVPHPEAVDAIDRLYSPFCPGFMLEVCPSPNAAALRDSLHAMAYQGSTSDELVDWMLARYGRVYLAVPEGRGWGLWAWVLPPLGLLLGAGCVVFFVRGAAKRKGDEPSGDLSPLPSHVVSGAEEARLREAIREIELAEDPSF